MVLTTNKYMKNMKQSVFVFGFTCDIKEINITNVLVTRIDYYANFERRLTMTKKIFKSESETGRTGASLTKRRSKLPEAVWTSAERAIALLPKFNFIMRASG